MRYTSLCLKINSDKFSSKRLFLSLGSLLLLVLLLSSSLFYAFNGVSPFVSAKDPVYVDDFIALQNAVNGADGFTIIGLTTDILIPSGTALIIPSGKDVALVSIADNEKAGLWKLVGTSGQDTITIEIDGKLTLGTSTFEGIVVTHDIYNDDSDVAVYGRGITVSFGGSLVMYSGEVFGNTADFIIDDDFFDDGHGGGVSVDGSFVMSGGLISNNRGNGFVGGGRGGGVYVSDLGSFVMSGGAISNNHGGVGGGVGGGGAGGGVYVNGGSFVMSGGMIDHNSANGGGGVYVNGGSFVMSGGMIEHNGSGGAMGGGRGGGVYCSNSFVMGGDAMIANNGANMGGGVFAGSISMMDNAMIANNHANIFGGGVNVDSISMMDNAMIANNHAGINGGGVYVSVSFSMVDNACVANNTANSGGGVYVSWSYYGGGSFVMFGGVISGNVAFDNGGGVWVTDGVSDFDRFVIDESAVGVVFENNHASTAYNRNSAHDVAYNTYIAGAVVSWTEPFTQGYNNYDISYVFDGDLFSLCTVTFDVTTHYPGFIGNLPQRKEVVVGTPYGVLPDLSGSRAGYTFEGWFTDVVFGDSLVTELDTVAITVDHILYAHWIAVDYSVTYDANGGNNAPVDSEIYHVGDTVTVSADVPKRDGYTFAGWLYNGVVYDDNMFVMPADDVVLVAQWKAANVGYVVHYYLVGSTTSLVASKTGSGTVGTLVTENSVTIPGYAVDIAYPKGL